MTPALRSFPFQLIPTWLLSVATLSAVTLVQAQPSQVRLPASAQGAGAISALGAHLPAVAKAYGLKSEELISLFQTQPALTVDQEGALLFVCEGLAVSNAARHGNSAVKVSAEIEADALTASSSVTILATGGTLDAFKLHSLPGATRVIFLDFTGHVTTGTSWNSTYASGASITSAPFSLDTDSTTFSDSERTMIQRIWQRVAEDYAPFNVDVTTEDPGLESLRKTSSTDTAYGIRAVISPSNWYKSTAGGVAYVGSFSSSIDQGCFAFVQQLANNEKYIAEAVAHEVGHTLGLYHDGVGGSAPVGYYEGHGNWAPIMGVGYYKPLVQFSKGEYANANNLQDDLAVIANHIPSAGDDHGDTLGSATTLLGPMVADGGTIDHRQDVDIFRFDTGAGSITLTLKGPAPDTNVDLKAELLTATGAVLQTSDLSTTLGGSISASVAAGTYYLRVSGIAWGDAAGTGYSDYGSLGNYVITGTIISTGLKQAPVAAVTASTLSGTVPLTVAFSGSASRDADGLISSYQWSFGTGDTVTGVSPTYTYTTAGTYSVVLTVIDNEGLAGTATVSINVLAGANLAPVAIASANVTSGTAPVPVNFSGTGSADPDGTISGYRWDFGDGTSSTVASPSKTYTKAGNYTARLTVTDNLGAATSASVAVTIKSDPSADADVQSCILTAARDRSGTVVSATLLIWDRLSRPVAGATVTVQWSGVVAGVTSGQTDANGRLVLAAGRTKKTGTETATVTSVVLPTAGAYDPTIFPASTAPVIVLK